MYEEYCSVVFSLYAVLGSTVWNSFQISSASLLETESRRK